MSQYIPYSTRNNITDKDLAGLLDFLERDMGWDIGTRKFTNGIRINDENITMFIDIFDSGSEGKKVNFRLVDEEIWVLEGIPANIFFRTYRTLLPVIRDLYGK